MLETQIKERILVLNVFEWFTFYWKEFQKAMYGVDRSMYQASIDINKGDCAVAAISVGSVLEAKAESKVTFKRNTEHCWLNIAGDSFDTEFPTGVEPSFLKIKWSGDGYNITKDDLVEGLMPYDLNGAILVANFCEAMGVPVPSEIDFLLKDPEAFESKEAVQKLTEAGIKAKDKLIQMRDIWTEIKHESYFIAKEATMEQNLRDHVRDLYSNILICVLVHKSDIKVVGESYRKGPETDRTLLGRSRAKFIALEKLIGLI